MHVADFFISSLAIYRPVALLNYQAICMHSYIFTYILHLLILLHLIFNLMKDIVINYIYTFVITNRKTQLHLHVIMIQLIMNKYVSYCLFPV